MARLARLFVWQGRLRSGWRVGLYLVLYLMGLLAIQMPLVGLYAAYLMVFEGLAATDLLAAFRPDRLPAWFYVLYKVAELILLLPLTFFFCRLLDRRDFVGLGFRRDRRWAADVLLGLTLGGAQMLLILCIGWAGDWLAIGWLGGAALARGLANFILVGVLFVLVALSEEVMFRGYLMVNLREGLGAALALLLTSLLFGIFHILNPYLRLLSVINIALAGLLLGYSWLVTGNLWLPMAYHFSWNFFQGAVLALPVSGVRYGGLLAVVDRGTAPLVTGGAFGPEGGLVGTLALLLGWPVVWWWGRRRRAACQ